LTLATALCLERWDDVARLSPAASARDRQFGFILAALNGKANALRRMIDAGVDINSPSADLYSHGTALHHAVGSGSLQAVKMLVDAGAALNRKDSAWNATPLGWAEYYQSEHALDEKAKRFATIADYLRGKGGTT
jgi:Ankyrin repeats (3 copies)